MNDKPAKFKQGSPEAQSIAAERTAVRVAANHPDYTSGEMGVMLASVCIGNVEGRSLEESSVARLTQGYPYSPEATVAIVGMIQSTIGRLWERFHG